MKRLKILGILGILAFLAISAQAQTKRKRTIPVKNTPAASSPNEVREGADKVSIQLKNVAKFIYTLGGVARGIEDIDKDIAAGKIARNSSLAQKNETFKQNVIASIRGLRTGLAQLETDFKVKPKLKVYLLSIQGISELAAASEEQASAGQLYNSGKTLQLVIEKLADTLVVMP